MNEFLRDFKEAQMEAEAVQDIFFFCVLHLGNE